MIPYKLLAEAEKQKKARVLKAKRDYEAAKLSPVLSSGTPLQFEPEHPLFEKVCALVQIEPSKIECIYLTPRPDIQSWCWMVAVTYWDASGFERQLMEAAVLVAFEGES